MTVMNEIGRMNKHFMKQRVKSDDFLWKAKLDFVYTILCTFYTKKYTKYTKMNKLYT